MGDGQDNRMPEIPVKLDEFVRQIATVAGEASAQKVVDVHLRSCPAIITVNDIDNRVKELEECKKNVKGVFGWALKNWQIALVIILLTLGYFKSDGKITGKEIQEIADKVNALSNIVMPKPSANVGTEPRVEPAQNDDNKHQVN
jgi:hypothetical protein